MNKLKIILGLSLATILFTPKPSVALANDSSPVISVESSSVIEESSQVESSLIETSSVEEEITYPCNVVLGTHKYGDVLFDIEGGEVGDIVTIYAKPYSFYRIVSVKANDVELIPNEEGNYQFALIEGENIVTANFEIDDEQFAIIAENLANMKDGNWEDIFSIENITTIIFAILSVVLSSGYFITLLKARKNEENVRAKTAFNVSDESKQAVNDWMTQNLLPLIEKINLKNESTEETCKTLAKCFILNQEGTPESRIAIINELTNLQKTSKDLVDEALKIINDEVETKNNLNQEKIKALEELEKANSAIETTSSESEGRY